LIAEKSELKEKEKYSKAIGKGIRSLREAKDISIKDFEGLEDTLDRHTLSRIENGKTTPSVYTLFKICRALGISQTELFKQLEKDWK